MVPARSATKCVLALAVCGLATIVAAQPSAINATVDASHTGPPISKYLYGQFIEHLAGVINNGFWAEMVDDRKFYFPVTSQVPDTNGAPPRRPPLRRWLPIGPDSAVTMDAGHAYAGDHSPRVQLEGTDARGVAQSGLAVRGGKSYVGRIVLAGDSSAKVTVTLIWGTNADEHQSVSIGRLHSDYAKYPLKFTGGGNTENGHLEITGTGNGSFEIGAVSLMPADNIDGFRPEVIAVLKQLHSGVYRFPGGNFVSGFEWRDAIGDRDRRPPRMDYAWNAVQPNDVGIDEFMVLCRLLDVEPYITVNAGFGDAISAEHLVAYANGPVSSTMGRMRAENGHPEAYGIKWWGIGNEMYGEWQLGVMPLAQFEIKHNMFARAMRSVDPTIKLIASGAALDEMTVTRQAKRITGKVLAEFGTPGDWTGGMLTKCLDNFDLVSEHAYCYNNQHFDLDRGEYTAVDEPLVEWERKPANRVRTKFEAYQEYADRIPGVKEKHVPVNLDEWAYSRGVPPNSYKVVPAYAWGFNEMFRHTELFQMAAFTFATACMSANRTEAVLNPAGLLFKLYRDHFGTLPVEVTGNSPQPSPKYPVGGDQPKVNAGSDTYPLDVAAAFTADRKKLTVAVVNPGDSDQQIALSFKSVELTGAGRLWRMAPSDVNARIVVGQKPEVSVDESAFDSMPAAASIPKFSVSIYEFAVR